MGCMWRDKMMGRHEFHDAMGRNLDESSESAMEILDKRYARGEIEKQEYEEKKTAITRSVNSYVIKGVRPLYPVYLAIKRVVQL